MTRLGVLLMAYGSPNHLDEVEAYYTDIRRGRTPSPEEVRGLTERYRAAGGVTPLLAVTRRLAVALDVELRERGTAAAVYVGMKHWHPYLADAIPGMIADRVERLVAITLAPHYSRMSVGGYREALERALEAHDFHPDLTVVPRWYDRPGFDRLITARIDEVRGQFARPEEVRVVFTAHSLPERILEWQDPYRDELLASCAAVAAEAGLDSWRFAFQSAGHTPEPWLGPDLGEALAELAAISTDPVLVVPIGFCADHLEILYDLDVEAQARARELGLELRRTRSLNDDPALVHLLCDLVAEAALAPRS
ncbi:MAG: ferrochelatase [Candidatus Dormibacteria bacterium]